jgi:hypothetical protein
VLKVNMVSSAAVVNLESVMIALSACCVNCSRFCMDVAAFVHFKHNMCQVYNYMIIMVMFDIING